MSKKKILRVVLPVAAAVVVGVLCILFLTQCHHGVDDPVSDPDSSVSPNIPAIADDVEVGDREDFDWRPEAGDTSGKDESFNDIPSDSTPGEDSNSSGGIEDDIGLRHDESKNQGQEADFNSWNIAQP